MALMLTTKTLLLLIFVNIILIRTLICETPCSDTKYGCIVHLVMKDIQSYLIIRQETVKNGNWNTM